MKLQQRLQLTPHVGVVGVRLIDDEHPVGETPEAQRLMLHWEDCEQRLVDRARPDVRQEGFASVVRDPVGSQQELNNDILALQTAAPGNYTIAFTKDISDHAIIPGGLGFGLFAVILPSNVTLTLDGQGHMHRPVLPPLGVLAGAVQGVDDPHSPGLRATRILLCYSDERAFEPRDSWCKVPIALTTPTAGTSSSLGPG